jgi:hypothetical protein
MQNKTAPGIPRPILCFLISLLVLYPTAARAYGLNPSKTADTKAVSETMFSHQDNLQANTGIVHSERALTQRWQLIGPAGGEQVLDVDVDPHNSLRLYATTQNGIYRSIDGGSNWDLILSGFFRDLVIDPQNSDVIYTGPGVYKSIDGGDYWTLYNEGMTCANLATMSISASNPNILFTGSF